MRARSSPDAHSCFVCTALFSFPAMAGMMHIPENGGLGAPHTHGPMQCEGPSYVCAYQEVHKQELERLRNCVQRPTAGCFMHADLMWETHIRQTGRRSNPRKSAPVSIAYIPWVRVQDFVKGEEARPDAPCKFVCQGKTSNEQGALMCPRWNSYSAVIRSICNMSVDQHYAFCNVTELRQVRSLLHIILSSTIFANPIPGVQVSLPVWTK